MSWLRVSTSFFAVFFVLVHTSTSASVCPNSCICTNTRDGLHRATCSDLLELRKFTSQQKHHNINILDLSHNNITKVTHELDRLTEIVTLDLSNNGITKLNKFLRSANKLVHLNLANNRIQKLTLTRLPKSVSSLDLSNNLLQDVPDDIDHLTSLEHLELKGNPLNCSCENIMARNQLLSAYVFIDNVKCASPHKVKGRSWLKINLTDICDPVKSNENYLDMMMGDQPVDILQIAENEKLRSMSLRETTDLEDGKVIHASPQEDDDSLLYMKVGSYSSSSPTYDIEGSGEAESTTISDISLIEPTFNERLLQKEEVLPFNNEFTSDYTLEGSGEGSGFGVLILNDVTETTTPIFTEEFSPVPPSPLSDDTDELMEFPLHKSPTLYVGGPDWHKKTESSTTEKVVTAATRDTTVSEQIRVTTSETYQQEASESNSKTTYKTGTYICIAIIVILLVGLIGFAIVKGQIRRTRDRRLLRQQKRDVEKASKEMIDMNKSLLGKPAVKESPIEKRVNGKYELVPTHEFHQNKNVNCEIANGVDHNDQNGRQSSSPRDSNQNKSSSKDNNVVETNKPVTLQDTSFDASPGSNDLKKDNSSLSSEDIFVPIDDEETSKMNGNIDSDPCHPLLNGDHNIDSEFLSPSREYEPVYSPDMGRVRIKMTETPKPKTPVLVTRSRSNAGDIIITPAAENNIRNSKS